ncbi:Extracellular guanyl-specific ribonuclease Fl2 [Fusarium austroafricanum]|uniref:Extracellular guanyl-specific ribonuclease Fl2 n=1 Tax=Fusarium austroafricanum TaxID=2364996 RepID=A0A8H4JTG7_9HYPO|nr:Extracellular guanyl-specific ribonuclease Fl2 [Fusarium austroafricanum]
MPSLHDLDREMSHLKVSGDGMDDNSSTCSYYSLPDLEGYPWLTQIPASEVRKQVEHIPKCRPGIKYPHAFRNGESLPLQTAGPWLEYPLCLNGKYDPAKEPGPARIIVNPAVPGGQDVIYHRRKGESTFLQATYRPTGYRRKLPGCIPLASVPSPPRSPTTFSPNPSPPPSPGIYGVAPHYPGMVEISPAQAFAMATQQQWTTQNLLGGRSGLYPQTAGLVAGQALLQSPYVMNQSYMAGSNAMSGFGYY